MDATGQQTLYISNIYEKLSKTELKRLLYLLFSQYGVIIDVIACRGSKLRGQAWIVFKDALAAANAMRGKQGFNFYGKNLKIAFSTNVSNIVERQSNIQSTNSNGERPKRLRDAEHSKGNAEAENPAKAARTTSTSYAGLIPNKSLVAGNLPSNITVDMLRLLFQNSSGLVDITLNSENNKFAKINFVDEVHASMALRQLANFQLTPNYNLQLSYASL